MSSSLKLSYYCLLYKPFKATFDLFKTKIQKVGCFFKYRRGLSTQEDYAIVLEHTIEKRI